MKVKGFFYLHSLPFYFLAEMLSQDELDVTSDAKNDGRRGVPCICRVPDNGNVDA